jgi:hypothetical protein
MQVVSRDGERDFASCMVRCKVVKPIKGAKYKIILDDRTKRQVSEERLFVMYPVSGDVMVGDRVEVRWEGRHFWSATVDARVGDTQWAVVWAGEYKDAAEYNVVDANQFYVAVPGRVPLSGPSEVLVVDPKTGDEYYDLTTAVMAEPSEKKRRRQTSFSFTSK